MTTPPTGSRKLRRGITIVLATLVLGFLALEGLARLRLMVKYDRTTSDYFESRIDERTKLKLPIPSQTIGGCHINSLSFRGAEIAERKPSGTLRIACVGGSTTFCAEVNDDAGTWPEQIATRLRAKLPDLPIEVFNAGLPGIGIDETRTDYEARVALCEPDVVVLYHATNDLSRDSRILALERGVIHEAPDQRSWFAEHFVVVDLIEKNLRMMSRRNRAKAGDSLLDCDFTALASGFEAKVTDFVTQSAKGRYVVIPTFSTQLRADQNEARQYAAAVTSLYYMPYFDPARLLAAFAAYNDALRRAAKSSDALLVECADSIPGDPEHFRDSVHLTARGCSILAQRCVDAMLSDPRFERLVQEVRSSRPK